MRNRDVWSDLDSHSMTEIRRAYNAEVREMAANIHKEAKERGDDLHDVLHETVDGHEWIIYTYKAKFVCLASDNEDADMEELGERGSVESQAFMAMRQDIVEAMDAMDLAAEEPTQ